MLIADFTNTQTDTIIISGLFQWDYGQQLEIRGLNLPEIVQIHFSTNKDCGNALRMVGSTLDGVTTVKIPDVMLAEQEFCCDTYTIWAFVYVSDESSGETVKRVAIKTKSRPKPEDYTDPGTDDPFADAIEQIKQYADQAEQSAADAETARTGAEKAYQDTVNLSNSTKTEIEQTGQEQIEAINQAGDSFVNKNQGIENAGKTLIVGEDGNVVSGKSGPDLDALEKIAIKPTATGTDIVADDSADWRLLDLSAQGWTEQAETNGRNIMSNMPSDWQMNQGLYWEGEPGTEIGYNPDAAYSSVLIVNGVKNNTKYSFKNLDTKKLWVYRIIEADGNGIGYVNIPLYGSVASSNKEEYSFTISNENATTLYIGVRTLPESETATGTDPSIDITEDDIRNMQICLSEGDPTYEPYTGGQPSPSPEYQQEVENAGTYDAEAKEYKVDVNITGKNLWSRPKPEEWTASVQNFCSEFKIKVKKAQNVTFSFAKKPEIGSGVYCGVVKEEDGNMYKWLVHSDSEVNNVQKLTVIPDGEYLWVRCFTTKIQLFLDMFPDFQIEFGEERTFFQDYKSQTATVTSDRPLTKWDRLEKRDGKWGWSYRGENVIYDGSDDEKWIANETAGENAFSIFNGNSIYNTIFCNKLKRYVGTVSQIPYGSIQEVSLLIILKIENIASVDELRSWMAENPLNIWHEISNEEWVELPQEEQDALDSLTTYYPTTVIQNSENMEMTVKYVADPENYIRKNYQEKLEQVNALNARMTELENLIVKEN